MKLLNKITDYTLSLNYQLDSTCTKLNRDGGVWVYSSDYPNLVLPGACMYALRVKDTGSRMDVPQFALELIRKIKGKDVNR